jgi:cell division protein FtsB
MVTGWMMALGREMRRRARLAAAPTIFLGITAYFAWNATQGDRGLVAYAHRQALLNQVIGEASAAKAERDGWETRVGDLRPRHLNPDTLDERARAMLNLAQPDEIIIKLGPQDKLF